MERTSRIGRWGGWPPWGVAVPVAAMLLAGCIAETEPGPVRPTEGRHALEQVTVLNTFISDFLEIDQLSAVPPEDANLFTGNDPADGSASAKKPGPGTGDYVDWNDLGQDATGLANHRFLDEDLPSGKDPSSFPRSNECVGDSMVLSKMDLRYVAAANNNQFGYFAVVRNNNNGDAAYYWLFTRKPPKLIQGEAPCKPAEKRLLYDISGPDPGTGSTGDVLLKGHFHPGDSPLLEVYQATTSMNDVDAVSAIDYTSGLWALHPTGVAAVAVNTTVTKPGVFGSQGVGALTGGNFEPEIFAEAAVPISIFTGESTCGATYYATVISRSSGSGGTTPDLKDLVGPAVINFGSVEASATLTPTCGLDVGYSATAVGPTGAPLEGAVCTWTFDTGEEVVGCAGSIALSAGARSATVSIYDPVSQCADTAATGPLNVYPELSVTAELSPTCESKFGYLATPSGGSNPAGVSYDWSFWGGGSVSPSSSAAASGFVMVGLGGVEYHGHVQVTDPRTDLNCTADAEASTTPYAPLAVHLSLIDDAGQCPGLLDDAALYQAMASGGNGVYAYGWTGVACSGDQCEVTGDGQLCAEKEFHVTLSDTSAICTPADSETETYSKVTTINASDN